MKLELLSFLVKNPEYLNHTPSTLFEKEYYEFFLILSQYVEKYDKSPSKEVFLDFAQDQVQSDWKVFSDLVVDIYKSKNEEYAEEVLINRIKESKTNKFLNDMIILFKEQKYDDMERCFRGFNFGTDKKSELELFSDIDKRFETYTNGEVTKRIPTGIEDLDDKIKGGLDIGELGFILALPSGGKTCTLINLGFHCMEKGGKVLHISLEISGKKTAKKYDKRISGMSDDLLRLNTKLARRRIKEFQRRTKSSLKILKYTTRSYTVPNLRFDIERVSSELWVPDMVIIDYADLMKGEKYSDRRFELTSIYQDLRGTAEDYKTRLWTASQANRQALYRVMDNEILGMADVSEDFQKIAIADIILSLSQSANDIARNMIKIHVVKNREGKKGDTIMVSIDWDKTFIG